MKAYHDQGNWDMIIMMKDVITFAAASTSTESRPRSSILKGGKRIHGRRPYEDLSGILARAHVNDGYPKAALLKAGLSFWMMVEDPLRIVL